MEADFAARQKKSNSNVNFRFQISNFFQILLEADFAARQKKIKFQRKFQIPNFKLFFQILLEADLVARQKRLEEAELIIAEQQV